MLLSLLLQMRLLFYLASMFQCLLHDCNAELDTKEFWLFCTANTSACHRNDYGMQVSALNVILCRTRPKSSCEKPLPKTQTSFFYRWAVTQGASLCCRLYSSHTSIS